MSFLNETIHLHKSPIEMVEVIKSECDFNIFPCLESVCEPFEGVLLDAYGVFWGGNAIGLLPGCKETMERLIAKGKIKGIFINEIDIENR